MCAEMAHEIPWHTKVAVIKTIKDEKIGGFKQINGLLQPMACMMRANTGRGNCVPSDKRQPQPQKVGGGKTIAAKLALIRNHLEHLQCCQWGVIN